MTDSLRVIIPGLPPKEIRGNSHSPSVGVFHARRKAAQEWGLTAHYAIVDARNRTANPRRWTRLEKAHVAVMYVFPDNRARDVDNYSGQAMKPVQDALVRNGVLVDDSFQHLSVSYDARIERGKQYVELLITEVVACDMLFEATEMEGMLQ